MSAIAPFFDVLPLLSLFPTEVSPLRIKAAEPAAPAVPATPTTPVVATPTPAQTVEAARTAGIQDQNKGVMGLVHTSLTGLNNFIKNLPPRKTLLGE